MDWSGAYKTGKGMYGQASSGASMARDAMDAGKSVWSWLGFKEGGRVSESRAAQAGSFATYGPKYSLMPIKDHVVLMKAGGVVPGFSLKQYPGGPDSLTFVRQHGLMNKY
jgi:hypothetical protein